MYVLCGVNITLIAIWLLLKIIQDKNKIHGSNLSVRIEKDRRPLILLVQYESTCHQFVFLKRYWKGLTGLNFIQPKGIGEIIML